MGFKERLKKAAGKAAVIGSMAAGVLLTPEAKASHGTDDVSANQRAKDVPEFVVTNPVSEQQAEKNEAHVFLEKIKAGEKIEYNGITFDVPKLNASKDKTLKNFGFVFEGDQVGIKIHDDGKRTWSKNRPAKTYKMLMTADDFEGLMNALMDKDLGRTTSVRPENPHDWVYRDKIPHFYTVDKDGNQTRMTQEEASEFFERLGDVICAANSENILPADPILKSKKELIEKADGGWVLTGTIGLATGIQNTVLRKAFGGYEDTFVNMVVNSETMRKEAQIEFEVSQRVAIRRYDREQQELAEIAAERAKRGLPPVTQEAKNDSPKKKTVPTTIIVAAGKTTVK